MMSIAKEKIIDRYQVKLDCYSIEIRIQSDG